MNGDKSAKSALRGQKQQQLSVQKRKNKDKDKDRDRDVQREGAVCDPGREGRSAGLPGKRPGKASLGAAAEGQRSPRAQRKLSDASNASEDLSKDSGCLSGKLSSSDSSSEISDCPSEGSKRDSPSCDRELMWIDGRVYRSPGSGDKPCVKAARDPRAPRPDAAGGGLGLFNSPGSLIDLMMGETTEDLVKEVEDLRSENEYLKDEVEELRCEMLEMRDMFQEEEVYQLQELRLQLEQANKTCRILQYRLRKAERRSIRVAQTGQVDGELVRSLEHDIKVAKSVSFRLCNELEAVQKRNSQLEWDNVALLEKTQELEVAKQVLQVEVDKARENSMRKRGSRPTVSKAEKRLSQQIEDDSADLRCQLHFAKEELALMCKKLTKLVSESEAMREELAKYQSAYGDMDTQSSEGRQNSAHAREAEVKVHLKLVEEEATLLSRRIVELEVENRGLRAEMGDLREKVGRGGGGGGGGEEEEEEEDVMEEDLPASTSPRDTEGRGTSSTGGYRDEEAEKGKNDVEASLLLSEGTTTSCHVTREGPVGGEWDPSDTPESDNNRKKADGGLRGLTVKDYETLLALRDHSFILGSAIQLLMAPPKNGHCSSPSCVFTSPSEADLNGKEQKVSLPGPLNEALELLQAMLLAFIRRVEMLLTGEDSGKLSNKEALPLGWDCCTFSFLSGVQDVDVLSKQEHGEDLRAAEVKERENQTRQATSFQWDLIHSCRDPKMRLSLQILWILHQWSQVKGPELEGKEAKEKTLSVLRELLRGLSAELQDEQCECDSQTKATGRKAAECAISAIFNEDHHPEPDRLCSSKGKRLGRHFPPHGCKRRNWCYLSQEAAQLDREDPVKTWDHLIMPLSFPELDFEQMSLERSHTAPESSACRVYYSPPSARRVQLAQLKPSPAADPGSLNATPPWCTPPTSFSPLCLGSAANLSQDMKEAASWRQRCQGPRGGVACSGTQTQVKPQGVSVAVQTEGSTRSSPARTLSSPLARPHHTPTSLERPRASTSSPKLYRRHSASGASSPPSPSPPSSSRERAVWGGGPHSQAGLSWGRPGSHRGGGGAAGRSPGTKPPPKPAGGNRYGVVTEFLRRVSGRAERPAAGQRTKSGVRDEDGVPARTPPPPTLQRNDSVTRIVNQRFMRQREERASSVNHSIRHSLSTTATTEEGNYDCSSSSTLTSCFARPSRSAHRQTPRSCKLLRTSPPAGASADPAVSERGNQQLN